MNEDFVSYDLAVRLKKAGFDEPCRYYHSPKGILRPAKDNALSPEALNNRFLDEIADGVCTAVPLWQAQKWLREVHNWHIIIEPIDWACFSYEFKLYHKFRGYENANRGFYFPTYERALSAGIDMALELIEKNGE